jgi:hypothetical protein
VAGALGLAAVGVLAAPALAQVDTGSSPADAFGGFDQSAHASGLQFTYDSPNLLPVPSPIFQLSLPEATSTQSSGPIGYALASLAYPGALLSDLGPVVAQSGNDVPVPGYPVRAQAFYPAGPTQADLPAGPADMQAQTAENVSQAVARYSGTDLPGFLRIGGVTSSTLTDIEDGKVVSRARTELAGVDLLFGLLRIQSIVTDLVADSDGTAGASAGTTEVTGATVLGQPVVIDGNGIHLDRQPAGTTTTAPPNPLATVTGALGAGQAAGAGGAVTTPLDDLAAQILGQANVQLSDLLAAAGIKVRLLQPVAAAADDGSASRTAAGLFIETDYDGRTEPVLSQLLAMIPADQLPSDNVPGVPLPSSPQALVELLSETHITTYSVAPADVSVMATPAFVGDFAAGGDGGFGDTGGAFASGPGGGFATAAPAPAAEAGAGRAQKKIGGLPIGVLGRGMPAALVAALLAATAILAALGGPWLADGSLAPAAGGCPEGRDRPPGREGGGPP